MMNFTLLVAALAVAAPGLKDPKVENLVGTWEVESVTSDGKVVARAADKWARYTFSADGKWVVQQKGQAAVGPRGYTVDTKATPATIDLSTPPTSPESPTVLGIYKIEADQLTLCVAFPDRDRPSKFESAEGSKVSLIVLKRAKKE
jgi:uncharacterized protein (TIGR03067 family)